MKYYLKIRISIMQFLSTSLYPTFSTNNKINSFSFIIKLILMNNEIYILSVIKSR